MGLQYAGLIVLVTVVSSRDAGGCRPGFHTYRNSCYWFSREAGDLSYARSTCGMLGSYLAIIKDSTEDNFLKGYAKTRGGATRYFIGASDLGLEGHWYWEDSNWYPGEPNNHSGKDNCLQLNQNLGYNWNDAICGNSMNFICEYNLQ